MLSAKSILLISSFILKASSQALMEPSCSWNKDQRSNIGECQNAITDVMYENGEVSLGHITTKPNGCIVVGQDPRGCELRVCSNADAAFPVSRTAVAAAAQLIQAKCRGPADGYQGTGGKLDTYGLSDRPDGDNAGYSLPLVVVLARRGGMPTVDRWAHGKARKRSSWTERRAAAAAAVPGTEDAVLASAPSSSAAVLQARHEPIFRDVRPGLRLEVVTEQGQHARIDEMFASRVEDEFAMMWRQPGGPASGANAFFRHTDQGSDSRQYALSYAADGGHYAQDIEAPERMSILNTMMNLYRDREFPRLFVVRLWSGEVALGWFFWNIVANENHL